MRRYIYPLYDYNGKYFAIEHIYTFLREQLTREVKNNKHGNLKEIEYHIRKDEGKNLTFRGPCIVIYSCNKTNEMH